MDLGVDDAFSSVERFEYLLAVGRRDAIDHLKKAEKAKEMSEDELKRHEAEVDKLSHKYVDEIHDHQKKKDAELMEV